MKNELVYRIWDKKKKTYTAGALDWRARTAKSYAQIGSAKNAVLGCRPYGYNATTPEAKRENRKHLNRYEIHKFQVIRVPDWVATAKGVGDEK